MSGLLVLFVSCTSKPASHDVAIRGFKFEPETLRVRTGDTVVWRNFDFVPHSATAEDKAFDSGTLERDGQSRWIANTSGIHRYVCTLHPSMKGILRTE